MEVSKLVVGLILLLVLVSIVIGLALYAQQLSENIRKANCVVKIKIKNTETIVLNNIPTLHKILPSFVYNPSYIETTYDYAVYSVRVSSFTKNPIAEWYYQNEPNQLTSVTCLKWSWTHGIGLHGETILDIKEQPNYDTNIRYVPGYEDLRLFEWRFRLMGIVNCRTAAHMGRSRMFLVDICETKNISKLPSRLKIETVYELKHITEIDYDFKDVKNWSPFIHNDNLYLIHTLIPYTVLEVKINKEENIASYKVYFEENRRLRSRDIDFPDGKGNLCELRGGAGPIIWNIRTRGIYRLGIAHCRRYDDHFYSFFYITEVDPPFNILRVSHPFKIGDKKIEFVSGIAIKGDDVILYYGVDDSEARETHINSCIIEEMLFESNIDTKLQYY